MKRFTFTIAALASVSLFAAGCGSDSDSGDTAAPATSIAAQSGSDAYAEPAATGDLYLDTCNGVLSYIQTLTASGVTGEDRSPQAIGAEFLSLAQSAPDWAGKSDQEKADFERAVNAGVAGSC
ncbi:hypothetical protein GCM10023094_52240 [Rhodococcus olei]|uniref:DUF732 domain-containing protein n=1 Tax=Rhodococcus olei TaxID=2161675 RepID=A0ABP8PPC0_9NOCA